MRYKSVFSSLDPVKYLPVEIHNCEQEKSSFP
jgi:hypothetical protein